MTLIGAFLVYSSAIFSLGMMVGALMHRFIVHIAIQGQRPHLVVDNDHPPRAA